MFRWIKFASIASAVAALAFAAAAQQPAAKKAPRPAVDAALLGPQWVALFNGKDLTGWVNVGQEKWVVENGTIYGEGVSTGYGYLATEKDYKDFDLSLMFKCESGGNSGVYLRTRFKPGTVDVSGGYQVEIDRNLNRHTGGLYGDGRAWWVWPAPENETVVRPYDWNDMTIHVAGNRTWVRLNGVLMVDYTNPIPASKDGVIALQLHAGGEGKMRFKDIYIRDLSIR
jgi:hypothetical protein